MKMHFVWIGVGLFVILGTHLKLSAQANRIDATNAETHALKGDERELFAPPLPVYFKTGNPDQDEKRFEEMVRNWNLHHPDRMIDGEVKEAMRLGKSDVLRGQNKEKEPVVSPQMSKAQRILTDRNLGALWGCPGLPPPPEAESSADQYEAWVQICGEWMVNHPEAISYVKGKTPKEAYPFQHNPKADPDYPVYIDTGNEERDAELYHEKKLRYTEKMLKYQN